MHILRACARQSSLPQYALAQGLTWQLKRHRKVAGFVQHVSNLAFIQREALKLSKVVFVLLVALDRPALALVALVSLLLLSQTSSACKPWHKADTSKVPNML
jgi:hypothetical protein